MKCVDVLIELSELKYKGSIGNMSIIYSHILNDIVISLQQCMWKGMEVIL